MHAMVQDSSQLVKKHPCLPNPGDRQSLASGVNQHQRNRTNRQRAAFGSLLLLLGAAGVDAPALAAYLLLHDERQHHQPCQNLHSAEEKRRLYSEA
jgi:hypothetical protein